MKNIFAVAIALSLLSTGIYAQSRTSNPCGPTSTEIFNFRERCAKQAHDEFLSRAYKDNPLAELNNHYNPAMDKCFMLVSSVDSVVEPGHIWIRRSLVDAYDRKIYAVFDWRSSDKKAEGVRPVRCLVSLPSGEERYCGSKNEFLDLISIYMGNDGLK
jgi:hypothetical protein